MGFYNLQGFRVTNDYVLKAHLKIICYNIKIKNYNENETLSWETVSIIRNEQGHQTLYFQYIKREGHQCFGRKKNESRGSEHIPEYILTWTRYI